MTLLSTIHPDISAIGTYPIATFCNVLNKLTIEIKDGCHTVTTSTTGKYYE